MFDQHLYKSPDIELCLWTLQITISLSEGGLQIPLQSGVEKLQARMWFEPTILDLSQVPMTSQPLR